METRGDNSERKKEDVFQTPGIHSTVGEMDQKIIMECTAGVGTEIRSKSFVHPETGPKFCLDTRGNVYRESVSWRPNKTL